jgi:hypothetical protein
VAGPVGHAVLRRSVLLRVVDFFLSNTAELIEPASASSLYIGGFIFKEVVYLPDLKVPPHAHEQATLYVVLQGAYTEVYRKKTLLR